VESRGFVFLLLLLLLLADPGHALPHLPLLLLQQRLRVAAKA
jgi:hypothetical protein